MKENQKESGFTIVELLITMFVAAAFLMSGYQLYSLIIEDSGETITQTQASNVANEYLQKYKPTATNPCSEQAPIYDQPIEVSGLSSVTVSVIITCPYDITSPISKVKVDLKYGDKTPQQTVSNATYVKAELVCPTGFIPVPGSITYGTSDFCVMKYEAKNDGNNNAVSTAAGLPWVNIPQSGNSKNVSQGRTATSALLVDGAATSNPYYTAGSGLRSVSVDLGSIKDINTIKIWHYFDDGRTYFNTKTEVSTDNVNWTTVFDSATDGLYAETGTGKVISFDNKKVRYIRDWANGSTANVDSHWVEIQAFSSIDAVSKSAAACDGCHLITEAEWMTIAQNILSVASNWSTGTVGSGYIYSGHNDSAPNNALEASTNDDNGYTGETNTGGNQRRTLTLTNGQVIWDLAGNVYEWTSLTSDYKQLSISGSNYIYYEWTDISIYSGLAVSPFPSSTNLPGSNSWNSSNGIGQFYSSNGGTILFGFIRGGTWSSTSTAGILTLNTGHALSGTGASIGFRVAQ